MQGLTYALHMPVSTIDYDLALSLRSKGLSMPDIAKTLQCKAGTLYAYFSRKGYTKTMQTAKAKTAELVTAKHSEALKEVLSNELNAQAKAISDVPVTYGELFNSKEGQGRTSLVKSLVEAAKVVHGWGAEQSGQGSILTLLCLSPEQAQSQGVVKAIDVEATPVVTLEPAQDSVTPTPALPDTVPATE